MDISLTANAISTDGELAGIVVKASNVLDDLSLKERIRFHFWVVVALRRFEAIYVKGTNGSINQRRIEGFERSILTLISSYVSAEWCNSSKTAFISDYVKYTGERLSTVSFKKSIHPGVNNI